MYSNATYVFLFWKKVKGTKNTNIEFSMIPHGLGVIATNFDYFLKILLHFHFYFYAKERQRTQVSYEMIGIK